MSTREGAGWIARHGRRAPRGAVYRGSARPRVAITFDPQVFEDVRHLSVLRGVSFATIVREALAAYDFASKAASDPLLAPAKARLQGVPQVAVPPWVPVDLQDEYLEFAAASGEEAAASHVRKLKAGAAV